MRVGLHEGRHVDIIDLLQASQLDVLLLLLNLLLKGDDIVYSPALLGQLRGNQVPDVDKSLAELLVAIFIVLVHLECIIDELLLLRGEGFVGQALNPLA